MDGRGEVAMKIAFMFPGQGSLEEGMGREIVEAIPEARQIFRDGSEAAGIDLEKLCFETPMAELVETENQQPALVTTCLAINEAIRVRGFKPDFVVGHSVGEFAALAAAQSLTAAEAIGLVRERGLAMAAAAKERPGSMAAILGLEDEQVETLCRKILGVWPANYNCPGQLVISGREHGVAGVGEKARDLGAKVVRLRVSGAFHSPLVEDAAHRLEPALRSANFGELRTRFMSTVSSKLETVDRVPGLLVEQMTAPVRFTQSVQGLVSDGVRTFVEVGPGGVLAGLVKRIDRSVTAVSVGSPEDLKAAEASLAGS
jgi:[acyl-carrier-protein] S-malonyltransferase